MEAFEYFVVLSSLILGLGITQILMGFSDLIAHYKNVNFSLVHAIYAVVVFIIHLQDWWYSYQYSILIEEWTFMTALFLMSFHIVLFLQARVLFPTGSRSKETDMVKYFGENWKLLYFLGSLSVIISILQNVFITGHSWLEVAPFLLFIATYWGLIFFDIKNEVVHLTFVTLLLIVWIFLIVLDPFVIT